MCYVSLHSGHLLLFVCLVSLAFLHQSHSQSQYTHRGVAYPAWANCALFYGCFVRTWVVRYLKIIGTSTYLYCAIVSYQPLCVCSYFSCLLTFLHLSFRRLGTKLFEQTAQSTGVLPRQELSSVPFLPQENIDSLLWYRIFPCTKYGSCLIYKLYMKY